MGKENRLVHLAKSRHHLELGKKNWVRPRAVGGEDA